MNGLREFAAIVVTHAPTLRRDPSPLALARGRDYIAAHATTQVTLAAAAAAAGLSPWHFAHAFRNKYGMPLTSSSTTSGDPPCGLAGRNAFGYRRIAMSTL
jgi:AraC-like DNA-binding protein